MKERNPRYVISYFREYLSVWQHADKVDNVTHARKQWEKVVGPQELPLLVRKRVKNGVPLPFTLTMTRGSRYALVTYDVPTEESVGFEICFDMNALTLGRN